jgi:hypothetical protein
VQLVEPAIFGFLLLDVFADRLFVSTHCGHKISSGPEIVASEVLSLAEEASCNVDGALAFDETHNLGNAVLGRFADEPMYAIYHQVPFQYLALPLQGKFPETLTQMLSELFIERLPTVLGNSFALQLSTQDASRVPTPWLSGWSEGNRPVHPVISGLFTFIF